MTNAEKYEEVFGFPPITECPTSDCERCPLLKRKRKKSQWWCSTQEEQYGWWNSDYKGGVE